jgi:hypothetical protein
VRNASENQPRALRDQIAAIEAMTPEQRQTARALAASLDSNHCPGCSGYKRRHMSFCGRCYGKLPRAIQRRLYARIGCGYESAHESAIAALLAHPEGGTADERG